MLPAIGAALISGGSDLVSAYANWRQADINRDFQSDMANSSYQRRVADLKAAGLNPMLAYQQGGAVAPPGAQAQIQSGIGERSIGAAMTGAQLSLVKSQKEEIDSRTALNYASAASAYATTEATELTKQKIVNEIKHGQISVRLSEMDEQQRAALMPFLVALMRNDALRTELGLPKAANAAWAEKTWWKKYVSPFLPDIGSGGVTNSAATAAQLLK